MTLTKTWSHLQYFRVRKYDLDRHQLSKNSFSILTSNLNFYRLCKWENCEKIMYGSSKTSKTINFVNKILYVPFIFFNTPVLKTGYTDSDKTWSHLFLGEEIRCRLVLIAPENPFSTREFRFQFYMLFYWEY